MSENATTAGGQQVLAEAPSGEVVDLGDLPEDQRVVSPDVIRRLCVGSEAGSIDPRGLRIKGARIVEQLDLSFCTVPHPLRFESTTFTVAPDLSGAHLPALWIRGCSLPGLECEGLRVDRDLRLDSSEVTGAVELAGAKIDGNLQCAGATLRHEGGYALVADRVEISGGVFLVAGFSATGEMRLLGAKIGGNLECAGATLRHERGYALVADRAEISGGVFLREGFSAIGAVRLPGAKIGANFECVGATLSSQGDYALLADGAEINGFVFLREGFTAIGAVRLLGAKIRINLECADATLSSQGDYALLADGVEINGGVFLGEGFSAIGAVRLHGARIGGNLECTGSRLVDQIALAARDASIGGRLIFRGVRVSGGVDLFRASTATLDDDLGTSDDPLGSWRDVQPLFLDGFAYVRFDDKAEWGSKLRVRWLKQGTGFQQGAWQQLIEVYRAVGRDDEATRVAIAMHNVRLKRAGLPWYRVAGSRVLGVLIGYGYRPWRAGIWAAAIIAAFAVVVWHWSGMFVPAKQGVTGSPQPVAYATDVFLPIVDLGQAGDWTPTGWVRWVDWSVILLGWSVTTVFVAGFTRIVRSV